MKKSRFFYIFFRLLFTFWMLVWIGLSPLYAQDIKVTTTPDPVKAGDNLRISVVLGMPVSKTSVVLANGTTLPLAYLEEGIWVTKFTVPQDFKTGSHVAKLFVITPDNNFITLKFNFQVQAPVKHRASDDQRIQVQLDPTAQMSFTIDQLENTIDSLRAKNDTLNQQIDLLQSQVKQNQDDTKRRELDTQLKTLQKQLQEQESALQKKTEELGAKQKELETLQKQLQEKNAALEKQLSDIEASKQSLQDRAKDVQDKSKNLEKQQAELQSRSAEVAQKQQELETLQSNVEAQEDALKKREDALKQEAESLKNAQDTLEKRNKAVDLRESDLQKQKTELAQQQADAQKKAAQLTALQTALNNKQLSQAEAQAQMEQLNKELNAQKATIAQKQSQLSQTETQLKQEKDALNQLKQNLNAQSQSLEAGRKNLEKGRSELVKQQETLAQQEAQYNTRMQSLLTREDALNAAQDVLKKEQNHLSSQQNALASSYEKLLAQQVQVDQKQSDLANYERRLSERASQLNAKEYSLSVKETELTRQSETLEKIQSELANREQVLAQQNVSIERKNSEIKEHEIGLKRLEQELYVKSSELSENREKLERDKEKLELAQEELSEQESLVKQSQTALENKKAEMDALSKQLSAKAAEQDEAFKKARAEFEKMQAQHLLLMGQVDAQARTLAQQSTKLNDREMELRAHAKLLQQKMDELEQFKADIRSELDRNQEEAKAERVRLEARVQKLETLVEKLMTQPRLSTANIAALQQSAPLETPQKPLLPPQQKISTPQPVAASAKQQKSTPSAPPLPAITRRFSAGAYFGYHNFASGRDLANNAEIGAQTGFTIDPRFTLSGAIGVVSTKQEDPEGEHGILAKSILTYSLGGFWHFMSPIQQFQPHVFSGFQGDFSQGGDMYVALGVGGRYVLDKTYSMNLDYITGRESVFKVSLSKHFDFIPDPPTPSIRIATAPITITPPPPVPTPNPVPTPSGIPLPVEQPLSGNVLLSSQKVYDQYIPRFIQFADMNTHWADAYVHYLSQFDIVEFKSTLVRPGSETPAYLFEPELPITRAEAESLIVNTVFLNRLIAGNAIALKVSLNSNYPDKLFTGSMTIANEAGNLVSTLFTDRPFTMGDYTIQWNGFDNSNKKVLPGRYSATIKLSPIPSSLSKSEVFSIQDQAAFTIVKRDPTKLIYGISAVTKNSVLIPLDRLAIQTQARTMKLFTGSTQSDSAITRLEFVLATARAIASLGGKADIPVDLRYYDDYRDIPRDAIPELNVYIAALGYGGDDKERLLPFKELTRAEAATIMARFIRWQIDNKILDLK